MSQKSGQVGGRSRLIVQHSKTGPFMERQPPEIWHERDLGDGWTIASELRRDGEDWRVLRAFPVYKGDGRRPVETSPSGRSIGERPLHPGESKQPERFPTARLMREAAKTEGVIADAKRITQGECPDGGPSVPDVPWFEPVKTLRSDQVDKRRRHRDVVAFARTAAVYADLCKQGSRSPIRETAESRHLSISTVRRHIYEARAAGRDLLTPAPGPGMAGGELTEKAKSLLADT